MSAALSQSRFYWKLALWTVALAGVAFFYEHFSSSVVDSTPDAAVAPRLSSASAKLVLDERIDFSKASFEDLSMVPGLSPTRARLLDGWKTQHPQQVSWEQVKQIPGIGARTEEVLQKFFSFENPQPERRLRDEPSGFRD